MIRRLLVAGALGASLVAVAAQGASASPDAPERTVRIADGDLACVEIRPVQLTVCAANPSPTLRDVLKAVPTN
jgi:hypothetical protein